MARERRITREELRGWYLCSKYTEAQIDAMFYGREAGCVFCLIAGPLDRGEKLFILLRSNLLSDEQKDKLADIFSRLAPRTERQASYFASLSRDAAEGRRFLIPEWAAGDYNIEPRLNLLEGATKRVIFASIWAGAAARSLGRGQEEADNQIRQIVREVFYGPRV